ncbi:cobalamin-5-phosphate synthase family protein [Geobacillus kaustophilus]|uniref:Adenosylcobinamide-GDP ribazoletransferase n=1 Tax=Geobacillus kaustophilus TaxID=1462 RepID=A0A0D8BNZ6_GEOKU|nr:adenosylcobinamide-GDP ribazoletransferase [Geobacillus kaustophilus]KJE25836.1 cobalamin-5-phosphate synthase family protein [Geobacillus kaustophilus]
MKTAWNGWLLALQLFTIIPIRRSIEWNGAHVRWLVRCLPLAGALIGMLSAGVYALFSSFSFGSPLVWALLLLWLGIWMAGGMHADGFMDVSDAFFSYRDVKRRQEIMSDSRVGAFAVLSLGCLLSFRWLFLYESLQAGIPPALFIAVPLLSRAGAAWLLSVGKLAKPTGMAAALGEYSSWHDAIWALGLAFVLLSLLCASTAISVQTGAALAAAAVVLAAAAKPWAGKQFGGITGDVLGAFIEGGETLLWGVIWLLHSSAMG